MHAKIDSESEKIIKLCTKHVADIMGDSAIDSIAHPLN